MRVTVFKKDISRGCSHDDKKCTTPSTTIIITYSAILPTHTSFRLHQYIYTTKHFPQYYGQIIKYLQLQNQLSQIPITSKPQPKCNSTSSPQSPDPPSRASRPQHYHQSKASSCKPTRQHWARRRNHRAKLAGWLWILRVGRRCWISRI